MIGGQAPTVLPVMWVLVTIVFAFIALRLYTRIKILNQLGWDDHVYTFSGVSIKLTSSNVLCQSTQLFRKPRLSLCMST